MLIKESKSYLKYNKHGFTLIEVIVVAVILSVLMTVAVPSVISYIDIADDSKCIVNKHALETAVIKLYVKDYAGGRTIVDDQSFDDYLKTRVQTIYEDAQPVGNLQFKNICNKGGIVSVYVLDYSKKPYEIKVLCNYHDSDEIATIKTPEQIQRDQLISQFDKYLTFPSSYEKTEISTGKSFSLGKAIVSNKLEIVKEFFKDLGVDINNNIVSISNINSKDYPKLYDEMRINIGNNQSPSFVKIVNVTADNKGNTVNKGDSRIVTQYLFYQGKDANNNTAQFLYGTRIVNLNYTEKNNLRKYNVIDFNNNKVNDEDGLIGWNKIN